MTKAKQSKKADFKLFPSRRLFDSHCHLDMLEGYIKPQIEAAVASGITNMFAVAVDLKSSLKTLELQEKYPEYIIAGAAIHPEIVIPGSKMFDASITSATVSEQIQQLQKLLVDNPYKLIGECGLDYYWLQKNPDLTALEIENSKYLQTYLLQEQLKLASLLNLPVSLHSRESVADCINLCSTYAKNCPIIFHSFTGSLDEAKTILSLGYKIGINGIITYKSAVDLRNNIKTIIGNKKIFLPEDLYEAGFFLETDAPLLFPSNSRTREPQNSPKQLPYIWEFLMRFLNSD